MTPITPITIIGGGLAGLVSAISAAEQGRTVELCEAHDVLGGRARTSPPPFVANLGPHVLYSDGPPWKWLESRGLVDNQFAPRMPMSALAAIRFRHRGELRSSPPPSLARALSRRGLRAPVDESFSSWTCARWDETTSKLLCNLAGVFAYDADPGRLSAEFVWDRMLRVFSPRYPAARYLTSGWSSLIDRLEADARAKGVSIATSSPVRVLPEDRALVVATELVQARRLLDDDSLVWEGSNVALLDVGLESRRGDPFIVSDLDASGWAERFSAADPTLAPPGHSLVQVQVGMRAGESLEDAICRAEGLLDCGYRDWRDREKWHRRNVMHGQSGALDLPGTTWRDRPRVEQRHGVFLAGDMVAAHGLLSEVSFCSALEAADLAVAAAGRVRSGAA